MDSAELQVVVGALHSSLTFREKSDRLSVVVPSDQLLSVAMKLRDSEPLSFDMLCAHTAIDWLKDEKIELIYQLYSTKHGHHLMMSVYVSRTEAVAVPSLHTVWQIAQWQEREVYDLFGICYSGHPDLRRILLEDDWKGFPLLKDYKDDFMLERPW